MSAFVFFAAPLAFLGFGAWVAAAPSLCDLGAESRTALAFGLGALSLTAEATIFSLVGLRWSVAGLAIPLLVISSIAIARVKDRPIPANRLPGTALALLGLTAAAVAVLGVRLAVSRSVSMDLLFFWGVKAVRFADYRGIDSGFLAWPFGIHGHPNYPPLHPMTLAWSALVAGRFSWRAAPLISVFWVAASAAALHGILRPALGSLGAAATTAFWTCAIARSLAAASCGGDAEAPLLFFVSIAAALMAVRPEARGLAGVALAGAILTKLEGAAPAAILVLTVFFRDVRSLRAKAVWNLGKISAAPVAAAGLWLGFEKLHGLSLSDPARERFGPIHFGRIPAVMAEELHHLGMGAFGIGWLMPILALIVFRRRITGQILPLLLVAMGTFVLLTLYYMNYPRDLALQIGWTLPRLAQPALSMLILAAGCVSFPRDDMLPRPFRQS
jgi:hypothetical protein